MTQRTAILIGTAQTCDRIEQQLALLDESPVILGRVLTTAAAADRPEHSPVLGDIDALEAIAASRHPALAIISLPAVMTDAIAGIRTRLRRLHVPDRFMPTIEDQLEGVGPRTHIDINLAALLDRPPREIDEAAVRRVIAGKRILITGAGGSIGSQLSHIAARFDPAWLILVDRSDNALFEIDRQIARSHPHLPRQATLHDVVDLAGTMRLFSRAQPNIVFHAAAHKHVPMMEDHPAAAVDNNLFGTKSTADAADAVGVERFVMISTDKAVNPSSIMGATKRLAEVYIQHLNRRSNTAFSMVRFGNVLGSSGSVLEIWARQIADGGPLTVTHPEMTRYFMTIPEAAALVIQSASLVDPGAESGEVFLLDMGEPIRIVDMARRFAAAYGLTARLPDDPPSTQAGSIDIVLTGHRPGEKLFEELAIDGEMLAPTRHRDINIWMLPPVEEQHVERMLRNLSVERRPSSASALAELIRGQVPEMVDSVAA